MNLTKLIKKFDRDFDEKFVITGPYDNSEGWETGALPLEVKDFIHSLIPLIVKEVVSSVKAMRHNLNTDFVSQDRWIERTNGRLEGYNTAIDDVLATLSQMVEELQIKGKK